MKPHLCVVIHSMQQYPKNLDVLRFSCHAQYEKDQV